MKILEIGNQMNNPMASKWFTAALFGVGTFCVLIGAFATFGLVRMSLQPTALTMIGFGLFMLGIARVRSQSGKIKRKP